MYVMNRYLNFLEGKDICLYMYSNRATLHIDIRNRFVLSVG